MRVVTDYSIEELAGLFEIEGIPAYRARQVFAWIYQRQAREFRVMSDIPSSLRALLARAWRLEVPEVVKKLCSLDGTRKYLLRLRDGRAVESVSIPASGRLTGCISTQVGCKYACVFCASGSRGFVRDLTVSEIVSQALLLKNDAGLTHIVFMGMGEPLDNYDALMKAVRILNDPRGLHIGARRITISSSGVIPGIRRLAQEGLQVELSVSLHAADSRLRSRIMPINRKYPLPDLMRACRDYYKRTNRQITFEYLLLDGLNTSGRSVEALAALLQGMDAKVNLISYNPVLTYNKPGTAGATLKRFKAELSRKGVVVTHRVSRGSDIGAACGQLCFGADERGLQRIASGEVSAGGGS